MSCWCVERVYVVCPRACTLTQVWGWAVLVVAEKKEAEGGEKPEFTRMALKNMLIVVNKLPADLRFWVEVDRSVSPPDPHLTGTHSHSVASFPTW